VSPLYVTRERHSILDENSLIVSLWIPSMSTSAMPCVDARVKK
jgi:hypothetical protein